MDTKLYFRCFASSIIALTGVCSASSLTKAQFPPEKVYENLFFDNYLNATIEFVPRAYLNCQPEKIMANYKIQRKSVGRGSGTVIAQGSLRTFDCGRALDDGEGWLFRDTWSSDSNLCEGRLQLIDEVWHFDGAVKGKSCSFTGKSFLIPESGS